MFYKTFYITLISVTLLLFSSQKSAGSIPSDSEFKTIENLSKTPSQDNHHNLSDFLVNICDDDDETSSHSKNKLACTLVSLNDKCSYSKQSISSAKSDVLFSSFFSRKHFSFISLYGETSITIGIRCLKV